MGAWFWIMLLATLFDLSIDKKRTITGLIFSKPKKERKKIHKGQVNLWICLSIRVEYVLDSTCLWVHITASFPLCFCAYVRVCVYELYVSKMLICIGGFIVLMKGHVS